jgi:hypothetical protein
MSVLVKLGRHKAIFRDTVWRSSDLGTERMLNHVTARWIEETGGPPLNSRDPELHAVGKINRRVGATLILHIPAHRRVARMFAAKRQMELF